MFSKRLEKTENNALQSSIFNTVSSLAKAQEIAVQRQDIEALIVISERWMMAAEKIKGLDSGKPLMLGFTSEEMHESEQPDEH